MIDLTVSGVTLLLEEETKLNPRASQPNSVANKASSRVVIPQIFTEIFLSPSAVMITQLSYWLIPEEF